MNFPYSDKLEIPRYAHLFDNMSECYKRFERYLELGDCILDLGFGSGRDSKYFLEKRYQVTSVEESPEICDAAKSFLPRVRQCFFPELDYVDSFHGVWACASLSHVPKAEMKLVFQKVIRALMDGGVLYVSYKYGDGERVKDGRIFTDYTEESFSEFLKSFPELKLLNLWVSDDVSPENKEKWLNAVLRKQFRAAKTETEFRVQHSKIITYYQLIEMHLKGICSSLMSDSAREWFLKLDDYSSDAIGKLISKMKSIQKEKKFEFFSKADFERLNTIRLHRNYWCHECFGGEKPVVFQKQNGCPERVVKTGDAESMRSDLQEAFDANRWLTEESRKAHHRLMQ